MKEHIIALGSNLASIHGTPTEVLDSAFDLLEETGFLIRARSRFFRTPAFPVGAGPDFVNAAAVLVAPWSAQVTLTHLHAVETQMGRTRPVRWGERTLDLDLIAVDDQVHPDPEIHKLWRDLLLDEQKVQAPTELILPHPRLQDRGFVLVPLMDVAPDWCHPLIGLTVQQMHDALPVVARAEVVPL